MDEHTAATRSGVSGAAIQADVGALQRVRDAAAVWAHYRHRLPSASWPYAAPPGWRLLRSGADGAAYRLAAGGHMTVPRQRLPPGRAADVVLLRAVQTGGPARMIWLSGAVPANLAGQHEHLGALLTPFKGNAPERHHPGALWWAIDTGCFRQPYDHGRYLAYLARHPADARCLFATAPDVVGDAAGTWALAAPVLPQLRALGYRAALVAQDGIRPSSLDWEAFDGLFVGGTTTFKLSEPTYALAAEAKARGKWLHMGRANSLRRLRAAQVGGYDSADGMHLVYGPDRKLPGVRRWQTWRLTVYDDRGHLRETRLSPLESTAMSYLYAYGARVFACDREDVPLLLAASGWTYHVSLVAPSASPSNGAQR